MMNILVWPKQRFIDVPPFSFAVICIPIPSPPLQWAMHMLISGYKILDKFAELCHIFILMRLDFQNLSVQAVVTIAPVPAIDLLYSQAQVFIRYDLLVNSNSFHQG